MNLLYQHIQSLQKSFDEFTTAKPWELDENIYFVDATPAELKNFILSQAHLQNEAIIMMIIELYEYGGVLGKTKLHNEWNSALDDIIKLIEKGNK